MSDADTLRRAEFREIARRIVADDRERRKFGLKTDTAGQISRALEGAFKRGKREALKGERDITLPKNHLEWITIPSRPRSAFWSICLYAIGEKPDRRQEENWSLAFEERRDNPGRWVLKKNGENFDSGMSHEWGDLTVKPLVTRELLIHRTDGHLVLSDLGRATWKVAVSSCKESAIELVGTIPSSNWAL